MAAKRRGTKKAQGKKGSKNIDEYDGNGDDNDGKILKGIPSETSLVDVNGVAKICAALAVFLYANSCFGGFPYDDGPAVKNNPDVLNIMGDGRMSSVSDIWHHDFWGTPIDDPTTHKSYRPLVILSFRIDAMISSGAWIFHLSNTLLYALTAYSVTQFLASALPADVVAPAKNKRLVLLLASMWFVTHPIHTEAVAQIVGRAEILAAFLCLVASKVYTTNILGAVFCLMAACLCKETSVVMPLVLGGADVLTALLAPCSSKYNKPTLIGSFGRAGCMMLVTTWYFSFRSWLFTKSTSLGISNLLLIDNFLQHLRPMDKLRTALLIQAKYVQLLVWPFAKLSCDYSLGVLTPVTSWISLEILFVVIVASAVLVWAALALVRLRKTGDATLVIAFGWTFAPLIPASHIVDIGTVLAERLLFMPSIGVAMLICHFIGMRANQVPSLLSKWGTIVMCIVIFNGLKTLARVPQWTESIVLYDADLLSYPNSVKLNYMTAKAKKTVGRVAEEEAFLRAKSAHDVTQQYADTLTRGPYAIGLPEMAFRKTRTENWPQGANLTEALEYVDQAFAVGLDITGYDQWSYLYMVKGIAKMRLGLPTKDNELLEEAASIFTESIEYDVNEKAYFALFCEYGMTLALLQRREDAFGQFQECLRRHSLQIDQHEEMEFTHLQNYGILMRELSGVVSNDFEAARKHGLKAIEAVNMILGHSMMMGPSKQSQENAAKWQRVNSALEVLMAGANEVA